MVFGPRCRWPVFALSRVTRLSSGLLLLCLQSPLDALTKIHPHAHHACGPRGDKWHRSKPFSLLANTTRRSPT